MDKKGLFVVVLVCLGVVSAMLAVNMAAQDELRCRSWERIVSCEPGLDDTPLYGLPAMGAMTGWDWFCIVVAFVAIVSVVGAWGVFGIVAVAAVCVAGVHLDPSLAVGTMSTWVTIVTGVIFGTIANTSCFSWRGFVGKRRRRRKLQSA